MNIQSLIHQHPLLFADLRALGLSLTHLNKIAANLSAQLGGAPDFNLCYVLAALDGREFTRAIDVRELAAKSEITSALAQAVVLTIAPWVARFRLRAG
ncbi:MAG: hypothetical protein AAF529_09400 [Pseudomonadota bacterium]